MEPIVVSIDPQGKVSGMHRDEFNLGFLGKQKIKRASEILHDSDEQAWHITVPKAVSNYVDRWIRIKEAGEFDSYNTARKFEVRWMNECFLAGVEPWSREGRRLAAALAATAWGKKGKGGGRKKK